MIPGTRVIADRTLGLSVVPSAQRWRAPVATPARQPAPRGKQTVLSTTGVARRPAWAAECHRDPWAWATNTPEFHTNPETQN